MKKTLALLLSLLINTQVAAEHSVWSYETNAIGVTQDNNRLTYLDFNLSVLYPLSQGAKHSPYSTGLFFAFSLRFGQDINHKKSDPVEGKRFAPKIFYRRTLRANEYIDLGFVHESNGQYITKKEDFDEQLQIEGRQEYAEEHISRAWDYLSLDFKVDFLERTSHWLDWTPKIKARTSNHLHLRYYIPSGPLQGNAEEYQAWENNSEGKPRRYVSGIKFKTIYTDDKNYKYAASIETGYSKPLRHNTYRLEISSKRLLRLPLMIWGAYGYNSDLARYYQKTRSVGFAIEIDNF